MRLRIEISNPARVRLPPGFADWIAEHAPSRARGELSLALVTDAAMRRLNRRFRRIDQATDVLSFPAAPEAKPIGGARRVVGRDKSSRLIEPASLGEIVIAVGVARRQASAYGHSLSAELKVLALHGLLHLLGYDHETDQGQMRRVEERLRRRAGLPTGLIGRAPGRSKP